MIELVSSREGSDQDGRVYTITVTVVDKTGNTTSAATTVVCPHDQGKKQ